jgi:hypothetical protein
LVKKLKRLKIICNGADTDMEEIVRIMEETFKFRQRMINGKLAKLQIDEAIFCFSPLLNPAYVREESDKYLNFIFILPFSTSSFMNLGFYFGLIRRLKIFLEK